ncbi:MAG: efflux transporter outer membrane subunit [Burkholderiaceae bacterium]
MNNTSASRFMRLRPWATGTATALLLAACSTLAPPYERPAAPIAQQWPQAASNAASNTNRTAVELPWRELYTDPNLRRVIEMALENNRDLRVAALNIEKARAQYRIQRSELVPTVAAGGSQTAQRTPASVSGTGTDVVSRSYALDVGISSYEIDLFGRLRSLKDEALQSYLATEETRRATHISLIAEVAGAYLSLAADLDLQTLAQQTVKSRQASYELELERLRARRDSKLEVRQAEGELEDARAQELGADQQVAADRNALELLVGAPLPTELLPTSGRLTSLLANHDIPPGLPSDLLRNRPDILSAEHTLIGANANIGAARAAFFPNISLTTTFGRASNELSGLFAGRTWLFSPQISVPIFSGGRLEAQLETARVQREIYLARYEQSIQTAFREVADVLAQRAVVDGRLAAQRKRVEASGEALSLVRQRHASGVSSWLNVLDSQRTDLSARKSLIQAELSQQSSLVTLYKVLGGGWSTTDARAQTPSR